jgi:diguanylate cyclase (GGDEF)-like protein
MRCAVFVTVFTFGAAARRFADQQSERLEYMARHEPLTQLLNRTEFDQRFKDAVARSARYQRSLALLFIDMDGFKRINDKHGHQVGDEVLCEVANRIRASSRETDHAGRLGGDEFVLALEPIPDEATAECFSQRLLSALSEPIELDGERLEVSASIGVAMFPADRLDAEGLMHAADKAMYEAKYAGGGAIQLYSRLQERQLEG